MWNENILNFLPGLILLVVLLVFLKFFRKSQVTTLVLKTFRVQEKPDDDLLIYITGRKSGILSWFLTLVGLDDLTTLKVTKQDLEFKSSGLSGQDNSEMSLWSLSSVHCGYYKPIGYIILMMLTGIIVLALAMGLWEYSKEDASAILILGAIIILFFWLLYYFNKHIRILVQSRGGRMFGLAFSPSLIENVNVDIQKAVQVMQLMNKYVIAAQTGQKVTLSAGNSEKNEERSASTENISSTFRHSEGYAEKAAAMTTEELKEVIRSKSRFSPDMREAAEEELARRTSGNN